MPNSENHLPVTGVIGAGTMGHGIAQIFALAGCSTRLYDTDSGSLASAPSRIEQSLKTFVEAGLIPEDKADSCLKRVSCHPELEPACQGAGLVIEAAPEDISLKQEIYARIEGLVDNDAILCSNTSAISITALAAKLERPQRFLGTHFWNPPQVIPCVEVIPGQSTSGQVMDFMVQLLQRVGKEPVRVKQDIPGFLGNRLQHALQREAMSLVERGIAEPEEVDRVVKYGFGLRLALMGPLERADLGGLDVTYAVQKYLLPHLDNRTTPSPKLKEMVEQGHLGSKAGQGYYHWSPKRLAHRARQRDQSLLALLKLIKQQQ
ncbi:MAG: 3-hydroxyacyl-CoA dehydrogenase NAD-binding domain-containing protein [Desulfarculaceae bacterium]|jgi:3-hydroxyacyl-CoA dehydrogenase